MEGDLFHTLDPAHSPISIHSLRVEGDFGGCDSNLSCFDFNPLPPCGGRLSSCYHLPVKHNFNPLPPCGGRLHSAMRHAVHLHFNPLPPCGGRPDERNGRPATRYFNPLPPCGGRHPCGRAGKDFKAFQSTPSVWRETGTDALIYSGNFISIHSLRVEGDATASASTMGAAVFQSTPSVWRETDLGADKRPYKIISIHSLRVEGD